MTTKNILETIVEYKKDEVLIRKKLIPLCDIVAAIADCEPSRDFLSALQTRPNGIPAVIAEIKKASPSRGIIRSDFDPLQISTAYQSGKASAISVLTDQKYFQGDLDYISLVKNNVSLPVLRKDFIVDDYQIYESKAAGADAILLIAAVLGQNVMKEYLEIAHVLGLQCLVEVHNEEEMDAALSIGSQIIGINNRNLKTFETTIETTARLVRYLKSKQSSAKTKLVSESGIFTRSDMEYLGFMGVDAVLIGEALMKETDVESALKRLVR